MPNLFSRARRTALVALLVACSPLAAHADGLDSIAKNGTLRVAVPENYPPFGVVSADMKPQGTTSTRPRCSPNR